jgi:hypothetical protein
MQQQLTAGDTLNYSTQVLDYPPSQGWALKLRLAPRGAAVGSGAPITLTATASGDVYTVQAAAAITATWAPGAWGWATWVEKAGERYTVAQGQLTVLPDSAALAGGTDTRTHAERTLEAIEAVIEGTAGRAHQEYEVAGRRLKFTPVSELLVLRDRYRWEVRNQRAAAGTGAPAKLQVRL